MAVGFLPKALGVTNYDLMSEAYWGSIPNGTAINTTQAARVAQERFLNGTNVSMLPLVPSIPDHIIQKAIFGIGNGPDSVYMEPEKYQELTKGLRKELATIQNQSDAEIKKAMTMGPPIS